MIHPTSGKEIANETRRVVDTAERGLCAGPGRMAGPFLRSLADLGAAANARRWSRRKSGAWCRWAWDARILAALGASTPVDELTAEAAMAWSASLVDRPALHNRLLALARATWRLAASWGWVRHDPFAGIERLPEAPRRRSLTPSERAAFRASAEVEERAARTAVGRRVARGLQLVALTGCRPGEVFRLRWSEVDTAAGLLRLEDSKTGGRTVGLAPAAAALFRDLPRSCEFVFPGRTGTGPVRDWLSTTRRVLARAGIHGAIPYDLRRTWGTVAINNGVSIEAVASQLGHASIRTTERHYAHVLPSTQAAAAQKVSEAL